MVMTKIGLFFLIIGLFINSGFSSQGNYAIIIFGGYGGSKAFDERTYIRSETAYLYETLRNNPKYEDENIWIFNLDGETANNNDHYDLYTDSLGFGSVTNFCDANYSTVDSVFCVLNSNLNSNSKNLVLIFISGHQSHWPDGEDITRQWYEFNDGPETDSSFAVAIKNDLLEGTNNVNNITNVVFVTGFCASNGFYNGSPSYDELADVVENISFAAADTQNTASAISAGPQFSFMRYWVDQVSANPLISIDDAFDQALIELFNAKNWELPTKDGDPKADPPEDYPIKYNPGNWDHDWCINGIIPPDDPSSLSVSGTSQPKAALNWTDNSDNETGFRVYRRINDGAFTLKATLGANITVYNDYAITNGNEYDYKVCAYRTLSGWTSESNYTNEDDLPLICWITGPDMLEYKQFGTFYGYRAGDSGTPSYQWWKSYDEQNWTAIGSGSSVSVRMGLTAFYLKLGVTVNGATVYDYHTCLPGDAKIIEGNSEIAAAFPSGVFFYKIEAGNFTDIKRMLLLK